MNKMDQTASGAINSMTYLIMKAVLHDDYEYVDELHEWLQTIDEETDSEVFNIIRKTMNDELAEGNFLDDLIDFPERMMFANTLQEFVGLDYENNRFYQLFIKLVDSYLEELRND